MRKFLLILLPIISLSAICVKAQTGPGGIGDTSAVRLWLRANDLSHLSDGDNISTWTDFSAFGNDMTQPNPLYTPEYKASILNGNPVARFNKNTGRLRNTNIESFPNQAISVIFVSINDGGSFQNMLSHRSASFRDDFLFHNPNNITYGVKNNYTTTSAKINDNLWQITSLAINLGSGYRLFLNGKSEVTGTNGSNTGPSPSGTLALGSRQNDADDGYFNSNSFKGDIAEVIILNYYIDFHEHYIIANYLSAKYNIPLEGTDIYDEDDPGNGNYDFDVAGIGRFNSASRICDDSRGTGIVRIKNPTNLGNYEYMMWGHDNKENNATNTTDIPNNVAARLDRTWRVSEVSKVFNSSQPLAAPVPADVGLVDMQWDLSEFDTVLESDLALLVDTDNDGIFANETPITGAVHLGNNIFEFSNVGALRNNLRFTLATSNKAITTLPITLIDFTAKLTNKRHVSINWATATESNNAYFQIERSTDAMNWEVLGTKNGAGNSTIKIDYKAVDLEPRPGVNYYRLKQVDFDGAYSYSNIEAINYISVREQLTAFPNPTSGLVTVNADVNDMSSINVYDITGRLIVLENLSPKIAKSQVTLNFSHLKNGIYIVHSGVETFRIIKQ